MKKYLKKSEIIVYAVALMLITAGYFNYTANYNEKEVATYSEDVEKLQEEANTNIGDAVLVSNNEVVSENDNSPSSSISQDSKNNQSKENVSALVENNKEQEENTVSKNDKAEENTIKENNSVETNAGTSESDYFVSSKLEREKMYANMISSYQDILNNNNVSEAQKGIATQEISKINNSKNSIMICENLIMTKGFKNCVILINQDSVNIVVKIDGGLKPENVAQIQNIISREIGTEIENIHIMEK